MDSRARTHTSEGGWSRNIYDWDYDDEGERHLFREECQRLGENGWCEKADLSVVRSAKRTIIRACRDHKEWELAGLKGDFYEKFGEDVNIDTAATMVVDDTGSSDDVYHQEMMQTDAQEILSLRAQIATIREELDRFYQKASSSFIDHFDSQKDLLSWVNEVETDSDRTFFVVT